MKAMILLCAPLRSKLLGMTQSHLEGHAQPETENRNRAPGGTKKKRNKARKQKKKMNQQQTTTSSHRLQKEHCRSEKTGAAAGADQLPIE